MLNIGEVCRKVTRRHRRHTTNFNAPQFALQKMDDSIRASTHGSCHKIFEEFGCKSTRKSYPFTGPETKIPGHLATEGRIRSATACLFVQNKFVDWISESVYTKLGRLSLLPRNILVIRYFTFKIKIALLCFRIRSIISAAASAHHENVFLSTLKGAVDNIFDASA